MTLFGKDNNPGTDTTATTPNIRGHAIPTGTITGFTNPVVEYVEIYVSGVPAAGIRLAVYEGGTVDDPDGATLVDEGLLPDLLTGWNRVTLDKSAITPGSNVIWIFFKTDGDPMNTVYSTVSTENEDFDNTAGVGRYQSVAVTNDPDVAYPGTWPADTGAETAFWYNLRISVIEREPFLASVDGDEFRDADTGIIILGQHFEGTQGTGKVEISDNITYGSGTVVEQTITAWAAGSITFTAVLGALAPGTPRYVWVTNNSGERNSIGHVVHFHRAKALALAASANIAASGEDTTFRLSAPASKTTGDFGGGRIQDDENPGDTVDIALDEYREDEWCMEALPAALNGGVYQFRVLLNGVVPTTSTEDPRWTIGAAAAAQQHPVTVGKIF